MKANVVALAPAERKAKRQRARRSERADVPTPRFEQLPDLVTIDETARYFRVSADTIYEAIRNRQIDPIVRFGSVIRVPRGTLARITGADLTPKDVGAP